MGHFKLQRVIKAPLEKVWAVADFTKSAGPFPMEVAKEGDPALHGAGFERIVTSGKRKVVERLLTVDPLHSYTYTLVEGVPVKNDYLGKVDFSSEGDSTQVTWSGSFTPKAPGSGWIIAIKTKDTVNKILDAIEAESLRT